MPAHPRLRRWSASAPGVLAFVLAMAIALVPLWSADIPPLLDYHNHLARQFILAQLPHSEILQNYYQAEWHASPYLAMDGIIQLLARFLPIQVAGKIFLSLCLLLMALAPFALSLALHGRLTPIAFLGLLFVHNDTLSLGFVNYLFSVGFALCLLALWIRLREAAPALRMVLFPVLASLLFFSHLIGFAIYALTVGAYELGRHAESGRWRTPRAWLAFDAAQRLNLLSLALQCTLPLAIFLLYGPTAESVAQNTYGGIGRKIELLGGLFSYLIPPYSWTLDNALAIALSAALLLLLALRTIEIPKRMAWPLGAMLLFFFAMPMELFSGWGADHRLLPAMGLLLVGSLRPTSITGKGWPLALALIAALVATRAGAVTLEWRKANSADYAEYLRAFDTLSDGSKVFFAFGHAGKQQIWPRPVYHLPCLAVMKKQVYVPYLFTAPGIVPLQYKPEYARLQRLAKGPVFSDGKSPDWNALRGQYDYYFLVNERHFKTPAPAELVPVFMGDKVRVYKDRGWKIN